MVALGYTPRRDRILQLPPPVGLVDMYYVECTRHNANAKALRTELTEKKANKPMQKWKEWIQTDTKYFERIGINRMPDDMRAAYEEG